MTMHLSARLVWHDRGWDGRICDKPHQNAHCIVHKHIRESRDDKIERKSAGIALKNLDDWLPPCSLDAATYSDLGYVTKHRHPGIPSLPLVSEEIPPYSSCPVPYRWMLEESFQEIREAEGLTIRESDQKRTSGWVKEPDRQRELLKHFWGKLDDQSLVFYYCNHGNPLDENASHIVVGVGRIKEVGPQMYYGTTPEYQDPYPVWSRRITQAYPDQGVRIPYQEYLRKDLPTNNIICRIPRNAKLPFSYGGEHVSDDVAVAILERVIQCVEQVDKEKHIPGNWKRQLEWLNKVLAEAWNKRGPFPGTGSVLQYLGCTKGATFQRSVLVPMARNGENPWDYVLSILDGRTEPDQSYRDGLTKAREKWGNLKSRHALLSKLARLELTPEQIERIANQDQRKASGIDAEVATLVANPYILCEQDLGTARSEPVALETIDHGLRPEGDAALFPDDDEVTHDDRRRVRAMGVEVLKEAANSGDTVLEFSDFLRRIVERFPDQRACRPDREVVLAEAKFYQEVLWTDFNSGPKLVALKHLRSLEDHASEIIKRRAKKVNAEAEPPIDWLSALQDRFGEPKSEREHRALEEKVEGLKKLFLRRLSILTGSAGTGKTSILEVFLKKLVQAEGHHPTLLLAPTGKARIRLSTKTKQNAMTIHQFLLKQGWFMPDTFKLKQENNQNPYPASTVIIDECSMIPTDLFGTLLRTLDPGPLSRIILVGDPSQLPPIGPGRPFADIIEWVKQEHEECIASLSVGMRVNESKDGVADSVALALADGYRSSDVSPGDDEILAAVARGQSAGDLEVVFWEDHDELLEKLRDQMDANLGIHSDDYSSFNASLGIDTKNLERSNWERSEDWQILSPTRAKHFGTDDLNRLIQSKYKKGLIVRARRSHKYPRPFGEQEIVWSDKVINIVNQSKQSRPKDTRFGYVANGEIGIVKKTTSDCADVTFSTQTKVSYPYYRQQVDKELDLAYALTVHKAQGSDFKTVFLIIPQNASTLSRELIYTALTRFRHKLVLLIEKDIGPLLRLRNPEYSDTRKRNTHMFTPALRPDELPKSLYPKALIHRTRKNIAVRSKSEVVVADILEDLEISYQYEHPLFSHSDPNDFRLPDFTASFDGDIFYWEHLGMLGVPSYREAWERKKKWYEDNGYADQLITSEDGPDGSIDAAKIKRIAQKRILGE